MSDLYNGGAGVTEDQLLNTGKVEDLLKAMSAGQQTGRTLDGDITSGASLKTESLESTVKILTNKDEMIKLWRQIPKQTAYNTVEEFNQLIDYGGNIGIFNGEGETPNFTDSQYRRESVNVRYMGVSGEVTHPFQMVRQSDGKNALAREVQNKTSFLLREIDKQIAVADNDMVSTAFDGLFKQHKVAVTNGSSLAGTSFTLDSYYNDSVVVDARGSILTDGLVESATNAIMEDNFGYASQIIARPKVFSDYVKQFYSYKQVMVNNPVSATTDATMGQAVRNIQTAAGNIGVNNDIFFDYKPTREYNASATTTKAPAAPVKDADATAVTDTSNQFGSTYAGDYYYAVAAKNRYGESAMTLLNTSATPVSVASTESVDLDFSAGSGAYAAESYVIYRTEAVTSGDETSNKFYPILTISVAELAAGYDGAAATKARDRNRSIANTSSAMVYDINEEIFAYKQLFPMSRMDLAITSPSRRFMGLQYGTPVLYAGKKIARIVNIGERTS